MRLKYASRNTDKETQSQKTSVCMPNKPGKYIPGEWRSIIMCQAYPQSPLQPFTHKNLDVACKIAMGLPDSLIYNTTVAPLRLHLDEGDISKEQARKVQHWAICSGEGKNIGFLHTMNGPRVAEVLRLHSHLQRLSNFSVRKGMVLPHLWGGELI